MTVNNIVEKLGLTVLNMADGDREITGAYAGDLLSWVMSRAKKDDAWVTIMTNINICAVAALTDVACIIIADDAETGDEVIKTAKNKQINLLRSDMSMFRLCLALGKLI